MPQMPTRRPKFLRRHWRASAHSGGFFSTRQKESCHRNFLGVAEKPFVDFLSATEVLLYLDFACSALKKSAPLPREQKITLN
jgi:hypothetical protein